jgi:type IV pilus assembly protein PilP
VKRFASSLALAAVSTLVLALTGCTGDNDELDDWIKQQYREVKPDVPPIYPPKKFDPQAYEGAAGVEPFGTQKLVASGGAAPKAPNAAVAREQKRAPEHLESFPLDSMSMVGSLMKEGHPHALVKVENLLYDVTIGMHLGQNFGEITRITENEITLREWVQDASGEWVERTTSLQLQEKAR